MKQAANHTDSRPGLLKDIGFSDEFIKQIMEYDSGSPSSTMGQTYEYEAYSETIDQTDKLIINDLEYPSYNRFIITL